MLRAPFEGARLGVVPLLVLVPLLGWLKGSRKGNSHLGELPPFVEGLGLF